MYQKKSKNVNINIVEEFNKRYKKLNNPQKQAVDTLDGPVMVVAGPGTGKTELLSIRAANILKQTDLSPNNILCLTFTDAGALAIRERLADIIGPEGYKIAVHTFHSFGAEVINNYSAHFYNGAQFSPADDLATYEIFKNIFDKLPTNHPLASVMNGQYTQLGNVKSAIADIKRAGLTPDELETILQANLDILEHSAKSIDEIFSERMTNTTAKKVSALINDLRNYQTAKLNLPSYHSLNLSLAEQLEQALELDSTGGKHSNLSQWKAKQTESTSKGRCLKDFTYTKKLLALVQVYRDYLHELERAELYDFSDMIMRVNLRLEIEPSLKAELQEKYQYIMVDEFQDTNDAQMRLIYNLTDSPLHENRPNLMIVGDDDQAIYRFQGANLSNILDFKSKFSDVRVIPLTDNYRSDQQILKLARGVIVESTDRLENRIEALDKTLSAHYDSPDPKLAYQAYFSTEAQYSDLAKRLIADKNANPKASLAVIASRHNTLKGLLLHLEAANLNVAYAFKDDALESEPVQALLDLSRTVVAIANGQKGEANQYLPVILAHPAWKIDANTLWDLALAARQNKATWLDSMQVSDNQTLQQIAKWLVELGRLSLTKPAEQILDYLTGSLTTNDFTSVYKQYYFSQNALQDNPSRYLDYLNDLRAIRDDLRSRSHKQSLKLTEFVAFVNLHEQLRLPIKTNRQSGGEQADVHLMTAHGAKGLEFDRVYLADFNDKSWGETTNSGGGKLTFPSNLPLKAEGKTTDEKIRLIYVAMTRARDQLNLFMPEFNDKGKQLLPVSYLKNKLEPKQAKTPALSEKINQAELNWQSSYLNLARSTQEAKLAPILERYRLNPTHLNTFLDVAGGGGPEQFLLNQLLSFPQASAPSAIYGTCMHNALKLAHDHFLSTGEVQPSEDTVANFLKEIEASSLEEVELAKLKSRGPEALNKYLTYPIAQPLKTQQAEVDFSAEDVRLNEARLTGKIDLIDIDKTNKTIAVYDYKTGKSYSAWEKGLNDYDKIKLHRYRQQLLFYKLLIEASARFHGYSVTKAALIFIEPDKQTGEIKTLELDYTDAELETLKSLIAVVWRRITGVDFSLDGDYDDKFKSNLDFEATLLG